MVSESRTTTSEGSDGFPCCNFPNELELSARRCRAVPSQASVFLVSYCLANVLL